MQAARLTARALAVHLPGRLFKLAAAGGVSVWRRGITASPSPAHSRSFGFARTKGLSAGTKRSSARIKRSANEERCRTGAHVRSFANFGEIHLQSEKKPTVAKLQTSFACKSMSIDPRALKVRGADTTPPTLWSTEFS